MVCDIFSFLVEIDGGLGADFAEVLENDFDMGDGVAFGGQVGAGAAAGVVVDPPQLNHVQDVVGAQGNGGGGRLQWTNVMSAFVLRRFAELVAEGVRTDKGFKDVHLNAVARDLSEFVQLEVSGTQVYNHLRKWRSRWVKICRLKELSGAGWDEANYIITLDPEHYNGHVKDHPKDAKFLNTHLINYPQMQSIFASEVATGRFAMGSNEPLGQPVTPDIIDVDADAPSTGNDEASEEGTKGKKRKRGLSNEDRDAMTGMTDAIYSFAGAVAEGNHSEAAPVIYEAVMDVPNFIRLELMFCLNHMMQNKATALVFVGMKPEDKELWCRTHLDEKMNK